MNNPAKSPSQNSEVLTVFLQLLAIPAVLVMLWLGLNLFAESNNLLANGTVVARQEEILFSGDEWHRAFKVSYRYSVVGSEAAELGTSFVDFDAYERLPVGACVRVHYSPWKLLRLVEGLGSFIEGTSWSSRLSGGAWNARDWGEGAGLIVAIAFAWIAFRRKSRLFALLAVLSAGAAYPVFLLLLGCLLVFPFLFWAWRKRPSEGYGLLLLASLSVTAVITWWRIPRAEPMPSGAREETVATIRQLKTVKRIWTSGHTAPNRGGSVGQNLGHPFYMIDLEFSPPGSSEPLHAVDKIDIESSGSLQRGMTVPIVYPVADPRQARIKDATRNYDQTIFRELITSAAVGCALITFVAIPLMWGLSQLSGQLLRRGRANLFASMAGEMSERSYQELLRELEKLSPDDPRRRELDRLRHRGGMGEQG